MASNNQSPALVVMALMLFAAANPLSHAQLFEPIVPGGIANGVLVPLLAPTVRPIISPIFPGGVVPVISPLFPGALLSGLNASGRACCTANGNCPPGAAGLAGVPVSLNCTNLVGVAVTVGQSTVGANGAYNISVPNVVGLLGGLLNSTAPLPCNVVFQLPLSQTICPVLSAVNGTLTGVLSGVNNVVAIAGGLVGSVTVPSLTYTGSVTV